MVKTPRTRHSKAEREPMTIELGPEDVSRVADESGQVGAEAEPQPDAPKEDIGASDPSEAAAPDGAAPESEPQGETIAEPPAATTGEPAANETGAAPDEANQEPRPDEAYRDAPQGAAAQPRPSRGAGLVAGLVGGGVALVAAGFLQYAGVLGAPGGSGDASMPAIPASVETDIAGLKSEIEALKASGTPTDVSGVTSQMDGVSQELEQVKTDVASLKQAVESGGAGENAGLEALNAKIAEIESRIAAIGPGAESATSEDIAAINERIAGVEASAKTATEAGTDIGSRLGALEQSLSALTARVDAQAGQPKVALAIAASALKAAIERGSPFEPEIETFAAIAPDAPGLAELRAYAEKGVATRADILAETDAAATAMIAAANPPPAAAGFFERLLSSAESLVTVRPIGSVEGPGVPETVARMEMALQAGDLAKAVAEFDTLPEAAKAAGAPFADKIRARLAAEHLADQAIAAAMQAA